MFKIQKTVIGCILYFILSIAINLLVFLMRIMAPGVCATTLANVSVLSATNLNEISSSGDIGNKTDLLMSISKLHITEDLAATPISIATMLSSSIETPISTVRKAAVTGTGTNTTKRIDQQHHVIIGTGIVGIPATSISTPMPPSTASIRNKSLPTMRVKSIHTQAIRNHLISRTAIKSSSPSATNSTLKSHKTDAPMLNYIFDSHLATNKHHHYDRYGPHFEDMHLGENFANVTVQAGSIAYLNCRISLLQDKTVSWVKREQQNDNLQLLTVGTQTYSGDSRFSVEFQYPNNWRLRIADTNKSDEGLYECQISTHPPRVITTNFIVQAPEVIIVDEYENPLIDKYYEEDSTIQLVCIVRHISMVSSAVYWSHSSRMLNFDMIRGGISVKTDLSEDGANSTLFLAKLKKSDSGNYTCSIGPNDFYTITVHVLNGESLAELYHGTAAANLFNETKSMYLAIALIYLIINKLLFCQIVPSYYWC